MIKYFFIITLGFILGAIAIENKQYFNKQVPIPAAYLPDGGVFDGGLRKGGLYDFGRIVWPNGDTYEGEFKNGLFHGQGVFEKEAYTYEGEFKNGVASGTGKIVFADGSEYEGEVVFGAAEGEGYFSSADGEFSGGFSKNLFEGAGTWIGKNGDRYEGMFKSGLYHGEGLFYSAAGDVYKGNFVDGALTGYGDFISEDIRYRGEFRQWLFEGQGEYRSPGEFYSGGFEQGLFHGEGKYKKNNGLTYLGGFQQGIFHGRGILTLPNGERYEGGFENGLKHGMGTLTFAQTVDGFDEIKGEWSRGEIIHSENSYYQYDGSAIAEQVLYSQKGMLDSALSLLQEQNPERIDMYFVGVAGDGSQGVFRRELAFVKRLFDRQYHTVGRSLTLVNGNVNYKHMPLATLTSIRKTLNTVAAKMDREQDILFLFITSHGSADFKIQLAQPGLDLAPLTTEALGEIVKALPIKNKVIVISSCYAGGYVQPLKDENTMIIVASAADKASFGCSDASNMTYFGEAFFKDAQAVSDSFASAFEKTRDIVKGREAKNEYEHSNPLIFKPKAILETLKTWRAQLSEEKRQQALLIE